MDQQIDKLQDLKISELSSEFNKENEQVTLDASESENSEANDLDTSESSTTSSKEILSDEEASDENTDEGIFPDVMTKIRDLKKRVPREDSQKSEDIQDCKEDLNASQEASKKCDEELKRSMLYNVYSILTEFINLIEEHEDEIDSLRIVKKSLELLTQSIDYAYGNELLKDPSYALEISYLYLNLLKLSGFKKYLTHNLMNDSIKRIYEKYIVVLSLDLLVVSIKKSHFTNKDLRANG